MESDLEHKFEERKAKFKCLLAPPFTSCVTLAKILKSLTQFPYFKNGENSRTNYVLSQHED